MPGIQHKKLTNISYWTPLFREEMGGAGFKKVFLCKKGICNIAKFQGKMKANIKKCRILIIYVFPLLCLTCKAQCFFHQLEGCIEGCYDL